MNEDMINSLKSSKLFQGLSDGDVRSVSDSVPAVEQEYSKNQIIVSQGEPVSKIGIVKSGAVISTKYHFSGNAQILRIYNMGEIFSLDTVNTTLRTSPSTLISQADSKLIFISYAKIFEADSIRPEVKEILRANCSEILGNELIRLTYKIDVLSKRTLRERILTFLSLMRERAGSEAFDIGMNQEQFSQYLCVNRSVLSEALNQMRKAGLIDYSGSRYKVL